MFRFWLKKYGRPALVAGVVVSSGLLAQAQAPGNGGTTGGPPAPQAVTTVPLDGGAALLLAAGAAYGLKRLRRPR